MADFTEDTILQTDSRTYRGLKEIRRYYTLLLNSLPDGFFDRYRLMGHEVIGEAAYLLWNVKPGQPRAGEKTAFAVSVKRVYRERRRHARASRPERRRPQGRRHAPARIGAGAAIHAVGIRAANASTRGQAAGGPYRTRQGGDPANAVGPRRPVGRRGA